MGKRDPHAFGWWETDHVGEWSGIGLSLAFGLAHLGRNAAYQGVGRLVYDPREWEQLLAKREATVHVISDDAGQKYYQAQL